MKIELTSNEIMKARKLPGGDIVFASFKNQIVRLDPTGREIAKFPAFVSIWGGRLDVLPNGNVLVPEHDRNRVVEYDPKGKVVWEAAIEGPIRRLIQSAFDLGIKVHHHHLIGDSSLPQKRDIVAEAVQTTSSRPN